MLKYVTFLLSMLILSIFIVICHEILRKKQLKLNDFLL